MKLIRHDGSLASAIQQGPAATRDELMAIIRGTASPEAYGYTPELSHVARAYATECSLSQRAILRDAALLLLEQVALSRTAAALDDSVQALRLIDQMSWIAEALPQHLRRLERLWRAAARIGSSEIGAAILLALAQDGPVQTKEYWLAAAEEIGPAANGAAFDGLARLDLAAALLFVDQVSDAERRSRLLARVLPRLARNNLDPLLAVVDSATSSLPNRMRLEVFGALRRYGFIGADPRRASGTWRTDPANAAKFSNIAVTAAAQVQRTVTVHDYELLNQNAADSPPTALFAAFSLGVEDKFPSVMDDVDVILEEMSQ